MAIAAVGASPPAHVVAPPPTPPPAQSNTGPDKPNDGDGDDNVASVAPAQTSPATGTGQKVNIIA